MNDESPDPLFGLLEETMRNEVPPEVDARMRRHLDALQTRFVDPAVAPARSSGGAPLLKRRGSWIIAAIAALAVLIALSLFRPQPASQAWAQVATAVHERPWLHGVETHDGQTSELWISPKMGFEAQRRARVSRLLDYRLLTQDVYDETTGIVQRIPWREADRNAEAEWIGLLSGVFMSKPDPKVVVAFGSQTVRFSHEKRVTEGSRSWREFHFQVESSAEKTGEIVVRVDPDTGLPFAGSITIRFSPTFILKRELELDFPATGPRTIYDMGAPVAAEVVDRTQPSEHKRLINRINLQARDFDPYCAIVVDAWSSAAWSEGAARRVWRNGDRWRIELNNGELGTSKPVPGDVDHTRWWHERAAKHSFVPQAISDGINGRNRFLDTIVHFSTTWEGGSKQPGVLRVQRDFQIFHEGQRTYLPELYVRPRLLIESEGPMHIEPPYAITIQDPAGFGPKETILLQLRRQGTTQRYWIDPKHGSMVRRFEQETGPQPGNPRWTVEDIAVSPEGHWYPTVIRYGVFGTIERSDGSGQMDDAYNENGVIRCYYDFKAPVPDELFEWSGPNFRKTVLEHGRGLIDESALPADEPFRSAFGG